MFFDSFVVLALTELANAVTCVIDGIMVGRFLPSECMAAYGLAAPYFSIAAILSGILMVGAQTMCAREMSRGNEEKANSIYSTVFFLSMSVSVAATLICIALSNPIAAVLGARGESAYLAPLTRQYFIALQIGTAPMVTLAVMMPVMQLDGDNKCVKAASLGVAIADVAGDFANVFIFKGGLFGMGLATAFSYYVGFAIACTHFLGHKGIFKFQRKAVDTGLFKTIMFEGAPRGIMRLCEGLGPIITNSIILGLAGAAGMSALAIQRNVSFLVGTLGWGISGAVLLCEGVFYAQKDRDALKEFQVIAHRMNLVIDGVLAFLIYALAPQIAAIYNPVVNEVTPFAIAAIRCHAIRVPFMTVNYIFANYFQVIEKEKYSYFINISSGFVYLGIAAGLLGKFFGTAGFWVSFPLSEFLISLTITVLVFASGRKSKIKGYEGCLMIPDDYGVVSDNCLAVSVEGHDDILGLSENIQNFCIWKKADQKKSYKAALCVEEICAMTVEKAFNDGKKHCIDVKVSVDTNNDEIILYIRDDCKKFSLKDKMQTIKFNPDNPTKNVGVRIVQGMAKDVIYSSALDLNNLVITI